MRVALDAQLTVGTATGIGEYVRGLAAALRARNLDVVELRDPRYDPWRFDRRALWDQVVLPRRARASGAALLHCAVGNDAGCRCDADRGHRARSRVARVQSHAPAYARYYFGAFSLRAVPARGARFVVDSEFHAPRAAAPSHRISTKRACASSIPALRDDFCRIERGDGDGSTILAVGTVERRKNLEVLVRALPQLDGARLLRSGR